MDVQGSVQKLLADLHAFKSFTRTMEPDTQGEALDLLDTVIASDRSLQDSISTEQERQKQLKIIEENRSKLVSLDNQLLEVVDSLFDKICSLEDTILVEKEQLQALILKKENSHMLEKDLVLNTAQTLAFTAGPPSNWGPGNSLKLHRPPYPTEDLMRASTLFRKMNLKQSTDEPSQMQDISNGATTGRRLSRGMDDSEPAGFDLLDLDLNPEYL